MGISSSVGTAPAVRCGATCEPGCANPTPHVAVMAPGLESIHSPPEHHPMTISIGDRLPSATLNELRDGVQAISTDELFGGRKVLMFAVPGAFTPTCSAKHLPGYVEKLDAFRDKGVEVACLSVNDAFVMGAWARDQNVPGDLRMLADGNGNFAKALGLELDATPFGMGLRAKRFALYAEDGVVKQLHVEAPGEFKVSAADYVLEQLP